MFFEQRAAFALTIRTMQLRICREARDRGAEVRCGVVPEFDDVRMAFQGRLHDPTLDAASPSVDETHFAQAGRRGGVHELGDDRPDVRRRERVQVELALDWDADRDSSIIHRLCTPQ